MHLSLYLRELGYNIASVREWGREGEGKGGRKDRSVLFVSTYVCACATGVSLHNEGSGVLLSYVDI